MKPDTLNEENRKFEQTPLKQPLFVNSVPKSGTHLLRNIVRMFVPVEQQYDAQFIQYPNLQEHLGAFDKEKCNLSWGHLLFSDASAMELTGVRKIVLYRDPHSWVLARARFFLSDEFTGNIEHVKGGRISVEELLNLMIFGIYQKVPSLLDLYMHNAVAWMGTVNAMVKYEELVAAVKNIDELESEVYFRKLLGQCGVDPIPEDWRERVKVGSDRKQSGTARENLSGLSVEIPSELPETQKKLVEFVAPGLRKLLGYE
ncbi:hypothetical protein [Hyphococcus sp. DH-69]|uniref:hypothetical protein n=1 Tax=Hyphococcus formosus TaxID=3143534 RepID=UPI00398A94EE